jgi:large subunit ribosomal protein L32e
MTQTKEKLLALKKKMSTRRPKFLRQDYHHRMKVEDDYWRSPKGRHSKMKQRKRGHRASVAIGYRSPAEVRGLYKTGAIFIRIENLQQLSAIDPKKSVVILSSNVGAAKRYQLLKAAIEKNISVVNIDAKKFIAGFEAKQKAKKAKPETKTSEKTAEKKTEVKQTQEITPKPEHKIVAKKTQEDKFGA